METRLLSREEFLTFLRSLSPSMVVGMLFALDRTFCCDQVMGVIDDGQVLGVATIAPKGEQMSGKPTIVAVYVLPSRRGQGFALPLLQATVRQCLKRGFRRTRIEAYSSGMYKTIAKLPRKFRTKLEVINFYGMMDKMVEREDQQLRQE